MIKIADIVLIVGLFVLCYSSSKVRLGLFYAFVLYLTASYKVVLPFNNSESPRFIMAIILVMSSPDIYITTLKSILKTFEFRLLIVWITYLAFSYLVIGQLQTDSAIYVLLGLPMIYLIITSQIALGKEKVIKGVLFMILLGNALNIYCRVPSILNISTLPFIREATSHQQAGAAAMFSIPILLFLQEKASKFRIKITINFYILFCAIVLYLVSARRAIVGSAIVYILYKRNIIQLLKIILIVLSIYFYISKTTYAINTNDRIGRLIQASDEYNNPEEVRFRSQNIGYGLDSFRDRPFFGVGYLNWQAIYSERENITGLNFATHNGYIRLLSELGLIGIALFTLLIYAHLRSVKRHLTGNFYPDTIYTVGILFVAIFISSLGGDAFYSRNMYIYMAIAHGAKIVQLRCNASNNFL